MNQAFPHGWLSPARRRAPLVALVLTLAACGGPPPRGDQGPEGLPGVQGNPGDQGAPGAQGTAALAESTPLDRGDADCPFGGIRYDVGADDGAGGGVAGDGSLQTGEIDHTDFVCYPSGSYAPYDLPEGTLGTAVIDLSAGSGGKGQGGYGGEFSALVNGSGGHIGAFPTGRADDDYTVPTSADAWLGTEPLNVAASQTLTVRIIAPGAESTVPNGEYFTYNNTTGTNDFVYARRAGQNFQVTGISIQVGGTLIIPRDPTYQRAYVAVPEDIVNAGTLTTPLVTGNRTPLYVAAHHFYGESGSRVDLTGLDGTSSAAGGVGGDLVVLAGQDAKDNLWYFSSGGWSASSGCPPTTAPSGGIYDRGLDDLLPGAIGDTEGEAGRSAGNLWLCSTDEIFVEGALLAHGVGTAGQGGRVGLQAFRGGVYVGGAIDVSGSIGPAGAGFVGGGGGGVLLSGQQVVMRGAVNVSGGSVAPTVSCTFGCGGGDAGELSLQAYGGRIAVTGRIDGRGGDGLGSGGLGYGGEGANVAASTYGTSRTGTWRDEGPIEVSGDLLLAGGNGGTNGGYGGEFTAIVFGGSGPTGSGAGISLLGYTGINADGGAGHVGGMGGSLLFANQGSTGSKAPAISDVIVIGPGFTFTAPGAAVDFVPFTARGGAGSGDGDGPALGGRGGALSLRARDVYPSTNGVTIIGAPVDVGGGAGVRGGDGGFAVADGAGYAEIQATVSSRGGAGDTANATDGYGGEGGFVAVRSAYAAASIAANCDASGGGGFFGGAGGSALAWGPEANVSGDLLADGAPGSASGGAGGYGGEISLWSSDTFSVYTGDLSADAGSGSSPGVIGDITVDGFIVQSAQ